MSCEHGRKPACEAEGLEGTGTALAQAADSEEKPRETCQPRAGCSIRLLCGEATPFNRKASLFDSIKPSLYFVSTWSALANVLQNTFWSLNPTRIPDNSFFG